MRLRIKSVVVSFLFSLLVLCACSGCSSSDTQTDMKLISAEGEVEGQSIQSSYSYDKHDRLTSLYTKSIIEAIPMKAILPSSSETGLEYRMEYDDNGNITQLQLWTEVFEEGELISSVLYTQYDCTYVDNTLTESVESRFDTFGMEEYRKRQYDYDDEGNLITIQVYLSEYDNKAYAATPDQILTMTYDVNKNLTKVENKYMDEPDPCGDTYVMTYNADNKMVKHERYYGVDLVINDSLTVDYTYELVYDTIANTVTVRNTNNVLYSTVLGLLGKDIGYLNLAAVNSLKKVSKDKLVKRTLGSAPTLIPSKLMQFLFSYNYSDPVALLATQELIIEITSIYTGDSPPETTYFDTVLDENRYPQTMSFYNYSMTDSDLDLNFIWE